MTEFCTQVHGKKAYQITVKTDNKEHYLRIQQAARECVDNATTIDAEHGVHGHWIEHYAFGCFHYDCSICDDGFAIKNKQKELPNYCQNCGAKMDDEVSE